MCLDGFDVSLGSWLGGVDVILVNKVRGGRRKHEGEDLCVEGSGRGAHEVCVGTASACSAAHRRFVYAPQIINTYDAADAASIAVCRALAAEVLAQRDPGGRLQVM